LIVARSTIGFAFGIVLLFGALAAVADDVTGKDRILCSVNYATRCTPDGECLGGPPWNTNIPQFIEIDLARKTMSTTKASGQNRSTKIKNLERDAGLVIIQGYERGRAYSFVINEATGLSSMSVALGESSVAGFGACTPMPPE
jgi:hypothetical protein